MGKKILIIGSAAVIVLLLVVGSFSIGLIFGRGRSGGETPTNTAASAASTASTLLQETVEEVLGILAAEFEE